MKMLVVTIKKKRKMIAVSAVSSTMRKIGDVEVERTRRKIAVTTAKMKRRKIAVVAAVRKRTKVDPATMMMTTMMSNRKLPQPYVRRNEDLNIMRIEN